MPNQLRSDPATTLLLINPNIAWAWAPPLAYDAPGLATDVWLSRA